MTMQAILGILVMSKPLEIPKTTKATTTTVQVEKPVKKVLPEVTAQDVYAWYKVAQCETAGDWAMKGSIYSGGLGIRNDVWIAYGGGEFAPTAGYATITEQIIVAKRINNSGYVPDQNGCEGSW